MANVITPAVARKRGRALLFGAAAALISVSFAVNAFAADETPGDSIDGLIARARALNPDLAAAALESEAAASKVRSAGALDDPMLNLSRDQSFRQTMVTISQEFSLWGKRELRRRVAKADAAAAKGREAGVWQKLEERIKVTFAEYVELDRAIRTTEEIRSLLDTIAGTARARYSRGVAAQADVIRANLEQTRLIPSLSRLKADEQGIKARLNALIGRPATAPLASPTSLRAIPEAGSLRLDDLIARAQDGNPSLISARAEVDAAEGERKLVDKSWYPDVTLSLGTSDMPGMSPQPVVGVGLKIPLQWGVREAQGDAATAKRRSAQSREQAALLDIESELAAELANLDQAQSTHALLSNSITPQSEAAYRSTLASYERGQGDLTAVLTAAHQQLEVRLEILRVEREEQTAFAAIERIVGGEL